MNTPKSEKYAKKQVSKQESLCRKCVKLPIEDRLCSGMKCVLSEQSPYLLKREPCYKLTYFLKKISFVKNAKLAAVPVKIIKKYTPKEQHDLQLKFNLVETTNSFTEAVNYLLWYIYHNKGDGFLVNLDIMDSLSSKDRQTYFGKASKVDLLVVIGSANLKDKNAKRNLERLIDYRMKKDKKTLKVII